MKTLITALALVLGTSSAALADEEWIFARAGGQIVGYDTHSGSSGDFIVGAKVVRSELDGVNKVELQKFQVDCSGARFQPAGSVTLAPNGAQIQTVNDSRGRAWAPVADDKSVVAFSTLFCSE